MKGRSNEEKEGFRSRKIRTGGMHERRDSELGGYRKGVIQERSVQCRRDL